MANNLRLPYHPQLDDGYCLAACAQMVLHNLGIERSQEDLARELGTRPGVGVQYTLISRFNLPGLEVLLREGDLHDLTGWLDRAVPVIVFVEAGELPHWPGERFKHAVVVVGRDEQGVTILDPAAGAEPIHVPAGDFLLAWDELDAAYAVIAPRP